MDKDYIKILMVTEYNLHSVYEEPAVCLVCINFLLAPFSLNSNRNIIKKAFGSIKTAANVFML